MNANPDAERSDGSSPLLIASEKGHVECVRALLAAPNKSGKKRARYHRESDGMTPLLGAVRHAHLDVVSLLLDAGASVDRARTDGATPLWIAAYYGHASLVTELLACGADFTRARRCVRRRRVACGV